MNETQPDPFHNHPDQLRDANKKWQESEWLLNFLRTEGKEPPKQPTDQELLIWMRKH